MMNNKELTDSELYTRKDKLEHEIARFTKDNYRLLRNYLEYIALGDLIDELDDIEAELDKRDTSAYAIMRVRWADDHRSRAW